MKYLALFLFSSALACADDFATGQAARITIGQPNFTAQETGAPSQFQLGGVGGVAYANGTLLVTDANRVQAAPVQNRVLIYNNISRFVRNPADEVPQGIRCPVCVGDPDVGGADFVIGQPDFTSTDLGLSQTQLRLPTAVATNGQIVVVADTDNNRVLIWNSIPQSNGVPADVVVGQPDFKTVKQPPSADNKSLRGPQGVWIQGSRLYVADTQNNRVMVWNSIPTTNNQAADLVLGVPSFTTQPQPVTNKVQAAPAANNMLSPVSVTSDGARLFVADLGYNRVLVWNTIPTQTQQPADLALGQPNLISSIANNSTALCPSTPDTTGKPIFPSRCGNTLDFPRFALSDGHRLFVADGGNDRVLIFSALPTQSGVRADVILGQSDEFSDIVSDSTVAFSPDSNLFRSSADTIRTPLSLAFDGVNLFVTDPFDRRVLVFTVGQNSVSSNAIVNAASRTVFALGTLDFAGTITADDTVTVTIQGKAYVYKILKADTLSTVIAALVTQINSGPDPNVFARANPGFNEIVLTAKAPGLAGNAVTYSVTLSTNATIQAVAGGASLTGGQSAAELAPGTLITINGTNLSDTTAAADLTQEFLPRKLGGVEVYFDGIKAPLLYVSPTQINTQLPFDVLDASSVSSYVRVEHADGSVTTSIAIAIPVVPENPGIFALEGTDPRPAIAFHTTNNATAVVDVNGIIHAGDVATLTIGANKYTYTVLAADTFGTVRDALIAMVNANADEVVTAEPAGQFFRILLRAKATGAAGNGITVAAAVSGTGATLTFTALQATTCCASGDATGLPVDDTNPARPGEIITIFAAGLGPIGDANAATFAETGRRFNGPALNAPLSPVADAQAGGLTANVLFAGLKPGTIGVYEVQLQLSPSLPTNPQTQVFIAQDVFTSNIVTIPVVVPPTS